MQLLVEATHGPSPPARGDNKGNGRAATVEDYCVPKRLEVEPCSVEISKNEVDQSMESCISEDGFPSKDTDMCQAVDTEDDNERAGPSESDAATANGEADTKNKKKPSSVLTKSILYSQSWAKDSTYVRICEAMGVHINDNAISERTRWNAKVAIAQITTARAKSNMLNLPLRNFFRVHPDVRLAPDSNGPAYVVLLAFIFAGDKSLNRIVSSNLRADTYNISTQGEKWLERRLNDAAEDLSWKLEEALKEYQDDPSNLEFGSLSAAGHKGCSFYEMLTTAYRIVIEETIFNTDLSIVLGFADVLCNIDNSENNTREDGVDVTATSRSDCSGETGFQPAVEPTLASGHPVLIDHSKLTPEASQCVTGLPPDVLRGSSPSHKPECKPEIVYELYPATHSGLPGIVTTPGFHIGSYQIHLSPPNLSVGALQPVLIASSNSHIATTSYRIAYTQYPISFNFSQMAQPILPQVSEMTDGMQSMLALEKELPVEELEVSVSGNEQTTLSSENEPVLLDDAGVQQPNLASEIATSPPKGSTTDNQLEKCMNGCCKGHTHAVLSLEQAQKMAKLLKTDLPTMSRDYLEPRPQSCRSDLHMEDCNDWSNCECGGVTSDARPSALPQFALPPLFGCHESPFPMDTSSKDNGMSSSKNPKDNEMHYAENPRPNALRRRLYFAEADQLICLSPIKDNKLIIHFNDGVDEAYKSLFPLSKLLWRKRQFLSDAQQMYRALGKVRSEYQMLVALEMKYQVKIKALNDVKASGDDQD